MHIVHVLTRLLRAGSEENTLDTCRWQVKAGHQVSLIHGADYDRYWDRALPDGLRRIALPELVHQIDPLADWRAFQRLRRVYAALQPDVIHTHQSKAGILGRLAARGLANTRVVHGIHIVPFDGERGWRRALYLAAERQAARNTDRFLSVTEAAGHAFVSAGLASQVSCVRSGMDLDRFRTAQPPRDADALLGPGPRPPVALMMAAFEQRKRHVPFLRALAKELEPGARFKLLFAGQGLEEVRIRATVQDLGLQDNVVICGHRPDPEALFALADLSVLTSEREGLPRVAMQSMAAGCPMVVQNLPAISELIETGRNGWILPAGDMRGTAQRVLSLLHDPAALARLSAGARATDLSAWALETLGARTTALYEVAA